MSLRLLVCSVFFLFCLWFVSFSLLLYLDLGLSKDIYQNPVYREKCKAVLPIRWMSPESLLDGSSTTKSDVW